MSDRLVCDASALVALLLDGGPDGRWVTEALTGAELTGATLVTLDRRLSRAPDVRCAVATPD